MKNLLQKSLNQLTIFAFIVFALSVPSYFLLVDWIWLKELDENNYLIAERIENEFNEQNISDEKLAENIKFWNEIQPVSKIEYAEQPLLKDSLYTIRRENSYSSRKDVIDRFRGLKTNIKINNQNYVLVVETNVEETEETVAYIAMVTLLFFLILIVGFWILNRRLSKKIWQPFQDTLQKLKSFQLNSQKQIEFQETDTIEFAELNATLDKLLQHSITTYKNQKEFTENASHELQTPLAVLKNKLDILLQSNDLTERQYHIAEEMNKALIRSSRINKNLLLLAKIENSQFNNSELISFDTLVIQSMDALQEHFKEKNISIGSHILPDVEVKGNSGLTEVLINNLIINAIRHTAPGGAVRVVLEKSGFEVRNSGEHPLNTELLFKRFSRMSADNSGSGLGLSIVQEICRLHQWNVKYGFENNEHIFSVTF
ncbi:signal transduction histidine kinase [Sphingobacterium alimentarium]|uniref:histidine kinase n=1 Tax=Sphingobacterium alimentarium TaxID=797292 RepID=A0A4R3VSU7_9SPHI|nr:HAMP domain-containing sensor histidine kinase [Sphingobacterium alimentarium]TCV08170.1 signal transduction histidine kinase [Sphingobacterium alimentarium]